MFSFQLNKIIGSNDTDIHVIGEDSSKDLEYLLKVCKINLQNYDANLIKKAFHACLDASKDKIRKTGDAHYTHPLSVALILVKEIPLDSTSVASALLHEVMTKERYTKDYIKNEFGSTIANIVEGVNKIEHIESQHLNPIEQMENYRKLLLSLFRDVRIILIKLADRLHNMRTIEALSENGQYRMAKETMQVYAPFANRFGLRNIKWELEDLAFRVLNRDAYNEIRYALKATREQRENYIHELLVPIREKLDNDDFLKKQKVKYSISGRAKHIYSIYNKMQLRKKNLDELYDLFAIRVILETDDPNMCFYVYGIIASIYTPIPNTFKDYISNPKKNGYKSIHTAIAGIDSKFVELQIRTEKMHLTSEKGFAAHFMYKPGEVDDVSILDSRHIQNWVKIVREIFENIGDETTEKLLDNVRRNLFIDEIYIYTPKNELITLPKDSTPLDFAFHIHTQIGLSYIGAKVNGKIVPMDYKLKSGDLVEVLTSKNHRPSEDWIKIATTSKAKSIINKYLKDRKKEKEISGEETWKNILANNDISLSAKEEQIIFETLKISDKKELFYAVGNNVINPNDILKFLEYKVNEVKQISEKPKNNVNSQDDWNIENKNLRILHEMFESGINDFHFIIRAYDRNMIISDITSSIIELEEIGMIAFEYDVTDSKLEAKLSINSQNKNQIKELLNRLNTITGVQSITIGN